MKNLKARILIPPDSITDAQQVRIKVFQEEQGIGKELDFDGNDHLATHIVVYDGQIPVGTGRIRKIDDITVKIERVAVVSEMRGQGIGKFIMYAIDNHLLETGIKKATLDAQLHAKGFYENLGYNQEGEIFEEVGIPHIVMVKLLK
jgi:predicted GNAT family N-acyltransferase